MKGREIHPNPILYQSKFTALNIISTTIIRQKTMDV